MILSRYLTKEVYTTTSVVTLILLIIFLSQQFIRYLSRAAAGKLGAGVVFKIMGMQIPYLLGMLLPVGFFIGGLLAFGRLYVDNEMTVLTACGVSKQRLVKITVGMSLILMLFVSFLTFYVNPELLRYQERLKNSSQANTLLSTMMPGRFQVLGGGKQVYYIESISNDRSVVQNVFVARQEKPKAGADPSVPLPWSVTSATSAHQAVNKETGDIFIVIEKGNHYVGTPGLKDFRVIQFGRYGMRLSSETPALQEIFTIMGMQQLFEKSKQDPKALAEIIWRIVIPLSIPVLALLMVPLSYIAPRKGRYTKLLPAILLYLIYANMMFITKGWINSGSETKAIIVAYPLIALLLIALLLLIDPQTWRRILRYRPFSTSSA